MEMLAESLKKDKFIITINEKMFYDIIVCRL